MLWPSMGDEETRAITWSWIMDNYPQLRTKIGDNRIGRLAGLGSTFCTEAKRKEVELFFSAPSREAPGLDRALPMALENIDRCTRYTAWIKDDVQAWLKENAPKGR